MGKSENVKKYVCISGIDFNNNNRGTAALGYGAITFLNERRFLHERQIIISIIRLTFKGFLKRLIARHFFFRERNHIVVNNVKWVYERYYISKVEELLSTCLGRFMKYSRYGKLLGDIEFVAAINGGDGFSDIYGSTIFHNRLGCINLAMKYGIPLMMLPQTIGPFNSAKIWDKAKTILQYSRWVFVRDGAFTDTLKSLGIKYEKTKDLSYYMKPEPWNIEIPKESVGINISGLAFSNKFSGLEGQFTSYPKLMENLIKVFQKKNVPVFLIPHSYNYKKTEQNNDDLQACKAIYDGLNDKNNVICINKDLSSPKIKFLISKMSFFVGTRMHANFAAIYTGVPVFGLAYSYKFISGFNANGLNGESQTVMINNISDSDIPAIVEKVLHYYNNYE